MVVGGLYRESQEYLEAHHTDGSGEQSLGGQEGPRPQSQRVDQNPENEQISWLILWPSFNLIAMKFCKVCDIMIVAIFSLQITVVF